MTEDICVVGFRIFDDTNHKLALKKKNFRLSCMKFNYGNALNHQNIKYIESVVNQKLLDNRDKGLF